MKKYDVIIIGGGLGGLSSGAFLSKANKKVLLLEQFERVGGYATTWKRKGINIEGVLHEIDDIGEDSLKAKWLKELRIYDKLEFVKTKEAYRVIAQDIDFVMSESKIEMIESLKKEFVDEVEAIDNYFRILDEIKEEIENLSQLSGFAKLKLLLFPITFKNLFKYDRYSVSDFFNKNFKNEKLKLTLLANIGYYGENPKTLSFLYFAIAQSSYINGGGWFIKSGSQNFSDSFANVIRENSGEVKTDAKVIKILNDKKRAKGVIYKYKDEEIEAFGDVIINNASPIWAVQNLETPIDSKIWDNSKISASAFGIYIVAKGRDSKNPFTTFISKAKNIEEIADYNSDSFDKRSFSITDYGSINSGLQGEDRRFISIFAIDYYQNWVNLNSEDYKIEKERVSQILIDRAKEIYPDIEIIYYESATPLTMERYTKNTNGAIYGYSQDVEQSGRAREKYGAILPNLLNASAWGSIGGGYSAVIFAGRFAYLKAIKILS